jgi:hypothetical protein
LFLGSPAPSKVMRKALSSLAVALFGILALEAASQMVFYPSLVFRGGAASAFSAADWAVFCFAFLTEAWAASAVVFSIPRSVAALWGVNAPNDTPLFWVAASTSARTFWTNFHSSLFAAFAVHIYLPLGGTELASLAVLAFSGPAFHGFHVRWLAWAALNGVVLAAERRLCKRAAWLRGRLGRAANQAVVVWAMLALAVGGGGVPLGKMLAACVLLSLLRAAAAPSSHV